MTTNCHICQHLHTDTGCRKPQRIRQQQDDRYIDCVVDHPYRDDPLIAGRDEWWWFDNATTDEREAWLVANGY